MFFKIFFQGIQLLFWIFWIRFHTKTLWTHKIKRLITCRQFLDFQFGSKKKWRVWIHLKFKPWCVFLSLCYPIVCSWFNLILICTNWIFLNLCILISPWVQFNGLVLISSYRSHALIKFVGSWQMHPRFAFPYKIKKFTKVF